MLRQRVLWNRNLMIHTAWISLGMSGRPGSPLPLRKTLWVSPIPQSAPRNSAVLLLSSTSSQYAYQYGVA